jgi:DNA-binding protein HU-beta
MNKAELIDAVQRAMGAECSRSTAERALNGVLACIGEGLRRDSVVQLVGFGTFQVKTRAARTVRSPKTGEPIAIAASKTVGFRAGQALKEAVA